MPVKYPATQQDEPHRRGNEVGSDQDNHFEQVRRVTQGMQLILNALPEAAPSADDPAYVSWFTELMRLVESAGVPPIAYADYFDHDEGWEVGWGSGIRHPHPPAPPSRHR